MVTPNFKFSKWRDLKDFEDFEDFEDFKNYHVPSTQNFNTNYQNLYLLNLNSFYQLLIYNLRVSTTQPNQCFVSPGLPCVPIRSVVGWVGGWVSF